jgi:hypothetical protein
VAFIALIPGMQTFLHLYVLAGEILWRLLVKAE